MDPSLIEVNEDHSYHVNWGEVFCLPEFTLGAIRCRLFKRHGLPFLGSCIYCGRELETGDYIGWFEKYDPEHNEYHGFLAEPFALLEPIIRLGVERKFQTAHEDADALFKEAHK